VLPSSGGFTATRPPYVCKSENKPEQARGMRVSRGRAPVLRDFGISSLKFWVFWKEFGIWGIGAPETPAIQPLSGASVVIRRKEAVLAENASLQRTARPD
jgi:hypothetical protein